MGQPSGEPGGGAGGRDVATDEGARNGDRGELVDVSEGGPAGAGGHGAGEGGAGGNGDPCGEGSVADNAATSIGAAASAGGGSDGGVAGEGVGQGGDSSEEDDHNYEITDFSMVTPWERLIQEVEDILKMWGLDKGQLGRGWDGAYRATREHTVLNYSKTKGVQHRCAQLTYCGTKLLLRHVVWLPEGLILGSAGVCGIETIWNKRSSAATFSNYVHELGCCLGLANYLVLVPDDEQKGFFSSSLLVPAPRPSLSLQECSFLRSTLTVAQHNVGCTLAGFTPWGQRTTPAAQADFPYTFQGLQIVGNILRRNKCYLDAQASQETADAMRSPLGCVQYMRARYCKAGDNVTISLRDTHYLVEDGVEEVLLRPQTITKLTNMPVHPTVLGLEGAWRYVSASAGPSVSDPLWGTSKDCIHRLTVELTWHNIAEEQLALSSHGSARDAGGGRGDSGRGSDCLSLDNVGHMSVACQFDEHLPCPLALALERFCGLYFECQEFSSFRDIWDTGNDSLRLKNAQTSSL